MATIKIEDATIRVAHGTGGYPTYSSISFVVVNKTWIPGFAEGLVVVQYQDGSQKRVPIRRFYLRPRAQVPVNVDVEGIPVSATIRIGRVVFKNDYDQVVVYY